LQTTQTIMMPRLLQGNKTLQNKQAL